MKNREIGNRSRFVQVMVAALLMAVLPVVTAHASGGKEGGGECGESNNPKAPVSCWSDELIEEYNHDPDKAGKAAGYAKKRWPNQFAGYWIIEGQAKSRWGRVRVFVFAFTRDPRPKVEILRKRFRFDDSRYRPTTRPNTVALLTRTMQRVNRDDTKIRRGRLKLPDGRRYLFASLFVHEQSGSVRIERPWTGRAFRRWVRQRYGGLVTVRHGDFPVGGSIGAIESPG